VKKHILLPFSGETRLHWWSALFLCLLKKNALSPQTPEEEKLFYQAEVKYLRFGQLLAPEICANPIPTRSGKLALLENSTPWEQPALEALLDEADGVTLLISLASELAALEKRHGRLAPVESSVAPASAPADRMSALQHAPALEWIRLLIECLFQRNFTQKMRPLNFPLKIVLGYLPEDDPANRLNEAYTNVLKKYLRTFFAATRVSIIRTAIQENPSRRNIDALAQELGSMIGEIF